MSNQTSKTMVPKLRFPEFRDTPEWEEKLLGSVASLINDRAGTKKLTPMSITSGVGLVSQSEKFGREIAGNQYKNYVAIKEGDFAYNKSATKQYPEGFIALLEGRDEGAVPNSIFVCFRITDKYTNRYFLRHLFDANYHGIWLRKLITVGARAHGSLNIDSDDLLNMPIKFPLPAEQGKIADCLSSLDELITAEAQQLDALKAHKKGLMQQLFPPEGETVPKLRFPEFHEAPEWEKKPLGEICTVLQGYGFPEVMQGKKVGEYPFCKVSDISGAVSERGSFIGEAANYVDFADLKLLKAKPIPKGTTIFAKIGEALRLNRRALTRVECLIDNNAVGLKARRDKCDDYFIFLLSQMVDLNLHCRGAVPSVKKSTLEGIEVLTPSLSEQKKIADCLSPLDEYVTAQAQKLDALKAQKKGLMQQLFPSVDGVNG